MKKNYLKNLLPVVTMLLCSVVASAHDFEVDGIYYDFSGNNEVSVTYRGDYYYSYYNEYSGDVVIPETVTYNGKTYSVTSIGDKAFEGCSGLTSITIPNSVTSIGDDAFFYCDGLTSITMPNSVTSIENYAFSLCSGLTSITIPNSVTSIGSYAFYGCSGLTSIVVEDGNTVYDSRNNCNAIIDTKTNTLIFGFNNTIIPNSITSIGGSAFSGCSGLTSVTIGNSVTSIGSSAFYGCTGLTSIVVENGNTVYDSRNNCNAIIETKTNTLISGCKNTIIPEDVTSIGDWAFSGCTGLTSITIPNSVTSIGDRAFTNCTGLTSITIPNSVTSIGDRAFFGCSGLTSITIPNSVTSIESGAFESCTGLTSITIPNSVTSIESGAFLGCDGLTSITIPNSVTSIGSSAFSGCDGLTSITIPNSVTSIESGAFRDCSGLKSITIPNSVTSIEESAFDGCTGLTSITIPNSVTSIEESAFEDCTGLTSITIPNSVKSIGEYAFYDCSGLKKVIIGNSVTSIEESAFKGCDNIFRLLWLCKTPPEGYKNLKASMNYVANDEFTGLKNMVVVPYISSAFEVDDVMYVPTNPQKRTCDIIDYSGTNDTIIVGERVNYKGVEMTVENIMPYGFYNSGAIDYLSINCNTIGENCFVSSTDIKTIILGEKLSSIGDNLFSACNKLQKIYCNATVPPTCGENVFESVDIWNCELYVPAESMADYRTADVWSEFFLINEIPTGIEDVAEEVAPAFEITDGGIKFIDAEGKAVAVYSTAGAIVEKIDSYAGEEITLDKGVYIVRVGDKAVKVKL